MAENDDDLRTEEPTPRRREEARQRGQVAFSAELTTGAVVAAGVVVLYVLGPDCAHQLLNAFRTDLGSVKGEVMNGEAAAQLGAVVMARAQGVLGPLMAALAVVAISVCVAQIGFRMLPDRLVPDFERVSPAAGWSRLMSGRSVNNAILAILKAGTLCLVAGAFLYDKSGVILSLGQGSISQALASGWGLCIRLLMYLSGTLLIIGVIDFFFQWRRIEKALRMSRQEVRDEVKREEGDPVIRSRIRAMQRQYAHRKTLTAVSRATVVVTNPTHYSVALRYEAGSENAPVVVAKGAGVLARQMREMARRFGVPIVERAPLARALYSGVREGQEIPLEMFRAVAELIAFVFRLRGVPNGRSGTSLTS